MLRSLKQAVDDIRASVRPGIAGPDDVRPDASAPGPLAPAPDDPVTPVPDGSATSVPDGPATLALDDPVTPEDEIGELAEPPSPGTGGRRWLQAPALATGAALGMAVVAVAVLRWAPWSASEPADPEVVATYQGGTVTREQLVRQFQTLPREQQAAYRSPNGVRALVGDVVVHEVTRRWAEEKQVDQTETFREAMKHATEQIQLADVSDQLHQGRIQVGEGEIQAYYDQNRQRFGDRPLVEVREEIRRQVVEQKEQDFVAQYLKDLRERASLQVDYTLIDVPESSEAELAAYYQTNRERFRVPEQVRIAQIQVSVSLAGGDDKARAKAESARARAAASGEDFTQLHHELSDSADHARGGELPSPVPRGSRGPAFDEAVFTLPVDGISAVFKEGDSYYVVKVLERWPERLRPYEEVRAEIADALRVEREQQLYAERTDRTLFTIHSRRTTLGEFVQEVNELPPEERAQYAGADGKRKLLDRLIERLLVIEDASEQATDARRKDDIQHTQSSLLARLLHQEEVDERIQVGDDEVRAEYDRNRGRYADPPRVKVRYVRVSRGRSKDEDDKARAKIGEAEAMVKPGGLFGGGGQPADFAEVARQYSEDPETAARGGELDRWLGESEGSMNEVFEHTLHEALLPLEVGEITSAVPLGDSYYLFQIQDKQEARQRPFEEAASLIRQELEARKHEELSAGMERQLMDRMQLQIYDRRVQAVLADLGGPAAGTR